MELKPKVLDVERAYETIFVVKPTFSDAEYEEKVKEYEEWLKSKGAKIVHKEVWGLKKFAYPIQKYSSGYYVLFEFRSLQSLPKELERKYRLDEDLLRFLTVYLDKYGVEFNERRRKKMSGELPAENQEEENTTPEE